ncbi:hypothetical protein R1sor_022207 [Riccia sorocarpa]|uniref:Uncharacterized protein n=1 Tax=Riccia sorocarpa TaxID=122646 RepID=A0ABD3GKQ3_9MARC
MCSVLTAQKGLIIGSSFCGTSRASATHGLVPIFSLNLPKRLTDGGGACRHSGPLISAGSVLANSTSIGGRGGFAAGQLILRAVRLRSDVTTGPFAGDGQRHTRKGDRNGVRSSAFRADDSDTTRVLRPLGREGDCSAAGSSGIEASTISRRRVRGGLPGRSQGMMDTFVVNSTLRVVGAESEAGTTNSVCFWRLPVVTKAVHASSVYSMLYLKQWVFLHRATGI